MTIMADVKFDRSPINRLLWFKTFADQAVIAIENVRLFQELKRVVGAANGDERNLGRHRQLADGRQPVLDVVAENAARFVRRDRCVLLGVAEGNEFRLVASLTDRFRLPREEARPIDARFDSGPRHHGSENDSHR